MRTEVMDVTPEIAKDILGGNTFNRNVRQNVVDRYAYSMRCGTWELTGQGISISSDGTLLDGQHRLLAVVQSGQTVKMLVSTDFERSMRYDCGLARSQADRIHFGGRGSHSNNAIAAVNFLLGKNGGRYCDDKDVADYIDKYAVIDNIADDVKSISRRKMTTSVCRNAPTVSAIFTAINAGIPYAVCMRWTEVVSSGIYNSAKEQAAIAYRNYCISYPPAINSRKERFEIFKRVQLSISKFAEGIEVKRVNTPKDPVWMIPE